MFRRTRPVALLLAVLLLTGCAGTNTVEDLLRAPQLSTQLAVVQKALNTWLGESPQLKYPRSGDTSSPFLFSDLDGDGAEEAVVLYQSETSSLNVHLAVLEQQGEEWQVTQTMEGLSSDVQSIELADLHGDGGHELVVVYPGPADAQDFLAVYSYADHTLERNYMRASSCYLLQSVDDSGRQSLVIAYPKGSRMALEVLTSREGVFQNTQELLLDERFTDCTELFYSAKPGVRRTLVVDGVDQSGYTISEIIAYDPTLNRLTPYKGYDGDIIAASARLKPGLSSADIDGDGVVEIPVEEETITGLDEARKLSYVTWRDFTRSSNTVVWFGILDAEYGYFIRLPSMWQGRITVRDGEEEGSWEVCSPDGTQRYLTVQVRSTDDAALGPGYVSAGIIGQHRIMVNVNRSYLEDASLILDGIRVL